MNRTVDRLLALLVARGAVRIEEADTYRYGLSLLLSFIMNTLTILLLGFVTGYIKTVGFILLFYIPLQSFGGGYHANTHLRCYIITLGVITLSVIVVHTLPPVWLLAVSIPGCIILFLLAPVEHANAPFNAQFAARMRKIVRSLTVLFLAASLVTKRSCPLIASCLSVSLAMSAVSLAAALLAKRCAKRKGGNENGILPADG
ncbi:MAG: accessory gene regulator B family protein [Clostridia bacterium]|nr:accessory gene regulator B family protein [Clostridia bacterium]